MKYKVGDKVRIKPKFHFCSVDGFNNINMKDEFFNEYSRLPYCETVMTIGIVNKDFYILKEDKWAYKWTDEMIEGLAEEEVGLVDNLSSRWVNEFNLPEGYIFKDEDGNIINATKIVLEKKKKEYPKTYEECCEVLGHVTIDEVRGYKATLLDKLQMLLVCRDAYWKLYGEEMGLGKPWEPDCNSGNFIPAIIYRSGSIQKVEVRYRNAIFSFPTAEMRDAFKENFDPDIEICKELI